MLGMSNNPLKTYLRVYRRRTHLTQDDVAYFLGQTCGTTVSRHERGVRVPLLQLLLLYHAILATPIDKLYEGEMHALRKAMSARAKGLVRRLEQRPGSKAVDARIAYVKTLYKSKPLPANHNTPNANPSSPVRKSPRD
jgi:DNA-binding XRE family transcriptional regulator